MEEVMDTFFVLSVSYSYFQTANTENVSTEHYDLSLA